MTIGRQALSALNYLHNNDFTHRDLKLMNILITKWDAETDIFIIKLTDFGLAGIRSKNFMHITFCETDGYIAFKVIQGQKRLKELQKQKNKEIKMIFWLLSYDKSVDIWTLRKILQDLINNVPSCEKTVLVNKELTLCLIHWMMQEDFKKCLTAAECLKEPWITTYDNFNSLSAQKHNRLFTSFTESLFTESSFKKVIWRTLEDSFTIDECVLIMNALLTDESEYQNGFDQDLHHISASFNIEMKNCQATQLIIWLEKGNWKLFITHCHSALQILESLIIKDEIISSAVLVNNVSSQKASPSMQVLACRLLKALYAEGYNNNVTVTDKSTDVRVVHNKLSWLSISSIQVWQKSKDSIMLELEFEFDDAEWANSFWNKQCSVDNNIDSQSAYLNCNVTTSVNDTTRLCTFLEVMFSQHSFLLDESGLVNDLDQLFLPFITLNNNQGGVHKSSSLCHAINVQAFSVVKSSVTSIKSNLSLSSQLNKGVTYSIEYNDIMTEIS